MINGGCAHAAPTERSAMKRRCSHQGRVGPVVCLASIFQHILQLCSLNDLSEGPIRRKDMLREQIPPSGVSAPSHSKAQWWGRGDSYQRSPSVPTCSRMSTLGPEGGISDFRPCILNLSPVDIPDTQGGGVGRGV